MTKSEFTWSVLRLSGLSMFILGFYLAYPKVRWQWIGDELRYSLPVPPLILVSLGLYFLFFGRSVFGLLMREERKKRARSDAPFRRATQEPTNPRTTLTRNETIEFEAWLQSRPDLKSRIKEDQIALFRDRQNAEPVIGGKASPATT